jgi:CRP-like cAMP-binding protein
VDEDFVAKLIDVGSQVELDEGAVVWDDSHAAASLFLVLNGLLEVETRHGRDERGPGQVVGDLERLDGSEDVRVVAVTDARVVAVDRAAYEAALSG